MDLQTTYGCSVIFLCYMLNRKMINYSRVQIVLGNIFLKTPLTSLIKVVLLKGDWIQKLKIQSVIYWSHYIDNLNVMKKSNKKPWQGDIVCLLIREVHINRMDVQGQTPAKTFITQSNLHILTNNQWLSDFWKYCTSHLLLLIWQCLSCSPYRRNRP